MPRKMTYSQMREAGLCVRCGKPSEKSVCPECMERQLEYQRENIKVFREMGLCKCGNKPMKGMRSCQKCNEKSKEWYRRTGKFRYASKRAERKEQGMCVTCGMKRATEGVECTECAKKHRDYVFNLIYGMPIE